MVNLLPSLLKPNMVRACFETKVDFGRFIYFEIAFPVRPLAEIDDPGLELAMPRFVLMTAPAKLNRCPRHIKMVDVRKRKFLL
jgi:hypothetical protein